MNILHWPCPHNCLSWCRTDGSKTNHHPSCDFVDSSLIDVWRVSCDGRSYVVADKKEANDELARLLEDDRDCGATMAKEKMHREIYENLPEFDGW